MFWGDKNISRNISILGTPTDAAHKRNRGRVFVPTAHQPLIRVGVTSLPPSVSR